MIQIVLTNSRYKTGRDMSEFQLDMLVPKKWTIKKDGQPSIIENATITLDRGGNNS